MTYELNTASTTGDASGTDGAVTSRAYRLVKAGVVEETMLRHPVPEGHVVVEPTLGSICHADLRYFTGQRRPEAMARKLPMALIHEGIGTIVRDDSGRLKPGQRVVIVPSMPGYMLNGTSADECCPVCRDRLGDNYCAHGKFLASGTDGIAQDRLVVPAASAIPVPDDIPDEIAVLSELCSVSYHALSRAGDRLSRGKAAVFGDGPVGYLTAAMLHHVYGLGRDRLRAFGAMPEKLAEFGFAERSLVQEYDFGTGEGVDVAVECTGGRFSESAVNQAIELLNPGGVLILMGVTEERVPINTRDVLEKGITMIGSSRSSAADFIGVLEAMRDPACRATLARLLPDRPKTVSAVGHFVDAMNEAAAHREWKKTVLAFRWRDAGEIAQYP
ncbi:zinc-binding dehydrogenase [Paenibacillus flagellatus]|uniref:Dehydrogenase n=1 Tax=Paenibacillus flagellatus TaxID=2211139 RepID=A0A2V5K670_9BACL|nr:alcohol dehydrogenase catalytic domain-containing protein [Paenibacillus flagellatus]PYI53424.1 dehydrogenase [Paenibacillus flagellatus]